MRMVRYRVRIVFGSGRDVMEEREFPATTPVREVQAAMRREYAGATSIRVESVESRRQQWTHEVRGVRV